METNAPDAALTAAEPKSLGSLAQAARGNELKVAQRILIVIGALTLAVNGFALYNLPNEIRQTIQQNQVPAANVPDFERAVTVFGYLIYGTAAGLGLLFVVFGVIIRRFPVAITVTSLTLYVVATMIFGLLAPGTLAAGLFLKIVIILALFRSIKAARAYQSHTRKPIFVGGLEE